MKCSLALLALFILIGSASVASADPITGSLNINAGSAFYTRTAPAVVRFDLSDAGQNTRIEGAIGTFSGVSNLPGTNVFLAGETVSLSAASLGLDIFGGQGTIINGAPMPGINDGFLRVSSAPFVILPNVYTYVVPTTVDSNRFTIRPPGTSAQSTPPFANFTVTGNGVLTVDFYTYGFDQLGYDLYAVDYARYEFPVATPEPASVVLLRGRFKRSWPALVACGHELPTLPERPHRPRMASYQTPDPARQSRRAASFG